MNDGINYDSSKVIEGIKVVGDDISELEKAKSLIDKGFEKIKKAKGYSEIESKLMINEDTIDKMMKDCSSEFATLSGNISSLVSSIEKFDEIEQSGSNNFNMSNNQKPITQDQVKEAIELNFSQIGRAHV